MTTPSWAESPIHDELRAAGVDPVSGEIEQRPSDAMPCAAYSAKVFQSVAELREHVEGRLSDDTCPQCNSRILTNKAGDKWCSHANCEYGLNDF